MTNLDRFLSEHHELTRRYFLRLGVAGTTAAVCWPHAAHGAVGTPPELASALEKLESYLTKPNDFRDVSRGKPIPHTLPDEEKTEVGLTRETWQMEVIGDSENKPDIRNPLTKENGSELDFKRLMELAKKHAVRFPKVMTCNNIGCPLGMGIWEGVPLREVIWLTEPRRNIRRVFYYGYHNDEPSQMFRSSLPIGRVLEDPLGLPPIILCYKLNGEWLTSERGGPVRIVVPEAYGFKSVKWITHVVITNLFNANDTYAGGNNDIDSDLKTFAATLSVPTNLKPNQPIPITGYAQCGVAGLKKVQVWISDNSKPREPGDRYFIKAPWRDADILPPPENWGGDLPDNKIPDGTKGFDPKTGQPIKWPMRLSKAHWATLLPGLPEGRYTLRCRTIDENDNAQPMPRPFDKSGRTSIESVSISVKA